jgi:hypothetical protein
VQSRMPKHSIHAAMCSKWGDPKPGENQAGPYHALPNGVEARFLEARQARCAWQMPSLCLSGWLFAYDSLVSARDGLIIYDLAQLFFRWGLDASLPFKVG